VVLVTILYSSSSDKPLSPRDLKVTDIQRDNVTLSWQPPEDTGGVPLTRYIIERRDAKRNTYTSAGSVDANTLSTTVHKLAEGNDYYFRVLAENELGTSDPCELKEPVKPKSPFGE
jgi:titin